MKNNRRDFLKVAGIAGVGVVSSSMLSSLASCTDSKQGTQAPVSDNEPLDPTKQSIIGLYGPWASSLTESKALSQSFRNPKWQNINQWKASANERILDRLGIPQIGGTDRKAHV